MKRAKWSKEKLRRIVRFAMPVLIALAIPILLARCTPQWLPDSNRIVYLSGVGKLMAYNIETEESRQITALPTPVAGFAVLPKGERVAVASFDKQERSSLTFRLFDLEGRELHVSKPYDLKGKDGGPGEMMMLMLTTSASPDGRHLVAFLPGDGGAVTYDTQTKEFQQYPKIMSFAFVAGALAMTGEGESGKLPLGIDISSATPDGQGFVAVQAEGEDANFLFCPWGKPEPIVLKLSDADRKTMKEVAGNDPEKRKFGVATIPRWSKNRLVMHVQDRTLELDIDERTCRFEKDMRSDVLFQHAEKEKSMVLAETDAGAIVQIKDGALQLLRRGAARLALQDQKKSGVLAISISPDRKKLLTRSMADQKSLLRVFDENGRNLAELEHASLIP